MKAKKVTFLFFLQITFVEEYVRIKLTILFPFLLQRLCTNLIQWIKEIYTAWQLNNRTEYSVWELATCSIELVHVGSCGWNTTFIVG
jgi:hypothetical protein